MKNLKPILILSLELNQHERFLHFTDETNKKEQLVFVPSRNLPADATAVVEGSADGVGASDGVVAAATKVVSSVMTEALAKVASTTEPTETPSSSVDKQDGTSTTTGTTNATTAATTTADTTTTGSFVPVTVNTTPAVDNTPNLPDAVAVEGVVKPTDGGVVAGNAGVGKDGGEVISKGNDEQDISAKNNDEGNN